jgi:hypothetical protein
MNTPNLTAQSLQTLNIRPWARLILMISALTMSGTSLCQTQFDPRAHSDLDQVIMLCATDPGSARFDQAWLQWLDANPDADVDAAVGTVISRSGTIRSMAIPGMQPVPRGRRPDPDAVAERMLSLARRSQTR